jgi:hypothetical protein
MVKKVVKKKKSAKEKSPSRFNISIKKNTLKNNLLSFIILFIISSTLYYFTGAGVLKDIFYFAVIIFGSLALAFIIIFLILFFLKISKK